MIKFEQNPKSLSFFFNKKLISTVWAQIKQQYTAPMKTASEAVGSSGQNMLQQKQYK